MIRVSVHKCISYIPWSHFLGPKWNKNIFRSSQKDICHHYHSFAKKKKSEIKKITLTLSYHYGLSFDIFIINDIFINYHFGCSKWKKTMMITSKTICFEVKNPNQDRAKWIINSICVNLIINQLIIKSWNFFLFWSIPFIVWINKKY